MPVATFKIGTKVAIEATEGVAPGGSMWFQGGAWFDVVTDGRPGFDNRMATIFPTGHAGKRSMNQQAPVQGRKWSDGDVGYIIDGANIGLFLAGVLGSVSTTATCSTDFDLLTDEPINTNPGTSKSLVLAAQPSDSGAILRFVISGASQGGTIYVQGIDSEGNGASENITFASAGSFYTRNSFSAIGASSITITEQDAASVSIQGFKYWTHTFSGSNQDKSYSIEILGDATAGAASRSHIMNAVGVQSWQITTPADVRDGVISSTVTLEGKHGAKQDSTTINDPSSIRIWPAWGLSVSKDGVAWNKVMNQVITLNSGNRNYRTAANSQDPQGLFYGGRELVGSYTALVENEEEYEIWRGASAMTIVFSWQSPWKLTSTQNMAMEASLLDLYVETNSQGDDEDAQTLSQDFRAIDGATCGLLSIKLINGVPGTAYGNAVS